MIEKRQSVDKNYKHSAIPNHDFSNRFCSQPFSTIATLPPAQKHLPPAVFACSCPGMLPYPLNSGTQQRNSEPIWNGPEAQEISRSILDGDFTYCSTMLCPYLIKNNLPLKSEIQDPVLRDIIDNRKLIIDSPPTDIMPVHDVSCTIACPSCHNHILTEKREVQEKFDRFVDENIFPLLGKSNAYLHISGDGDPIGSRHYRKIMHALDPIKYQNVSISLHSNGLLLTEQEWASLSKIHEMIKTVSISIDAARKETYEILRKPGKWDVLSRNMDFLSKLRLSEKLDYLSIQFVVQRDNFKEIPLFIELGKQWGVDKIYFSRLFPTIHQDNVIEGREAYLQNAICEISHPQHTELLEVLRNPSLQEPIVDLFNMSKLVDHV